DGFEVRALGGYGFSDGAAKGEVTISSADGLALSVYRTVRDIPDAPVIAPLINSVSAQEWGDDYGDYYRASGAELSATFRTSPRSEVVFAVQRERVESQSINATPASGAFRPNPAVHDGWFNAGVFTARRRS